MESSWLTIPIQGIRELEHQSFRVIRAPDLTEQGKGVAKVEPRTVIDSRLTILAENFQSSGHWQPGAIGYGQLNYTWSYETPMGFVAKQYPEETSKTMNRSTLYIQGMLEINSQLQFKLHSLSALKQEISSNLINSLDELAKGSCVSQSSLEQSPELHSDNELSNQTMATTTNPLNHSSRN